MLFGNSTELLYSWTKTFDTYTQHRFSTRWCTLSLFSLCSLGLNHVLPVKCFGRCGLTRRLDTHRLRLHWNFLLWGNVTAVLYSSTPRYLVDLIIDEIYVIPQTHMQNVFVEFKYLIMLFTVGECHNCTLLINASLFSRSHNRWDICHTSNTHAECVCRI